MAWLRQHRDALARAFGKLRAQRSASLLNALVIGVALSLPAGGYALLANLQQAAQRFTFEPQVSVFLKAEAKRPALESRLRGDARVAQLRFVSREEALQELRQSEGLAEVVAALERNPLPDTFVLRARDGSAAALEALAADVRALPGVAQVQVDSAWAQRLGALARIGRLALAALATLLATGLVAVTFNTIRLQILTQREEIEVSKLIGATDAFIRRPFYYLGLLQGAAGGAFEQAEDHEGDAEDRDQADDPLIAGHEQGADAQGAFGTPMALLDLPLALPLPKQGARRGILR